MLLNLFEYPIGYMEFRAGEQIALLPGFKAVNGSRFWAHIEDFEPCDYTLEELMTDDEVPYLIYKV